MRESPLSGRWGNAYTARASKAGRSLMTSIGPSRRINRFLRKVLSSRVTVFTGGSNAHRHFFVSHRRGLAARLSVISFTNCLRQQ